jgi:hypothetical protein
MMRVTRSNSCGLHPAVAAINAKAAIHLRKIRRKRKPYKQAAHAGFDRIFSKHPGAHSLEVFTVELGNNVCVWTAVTPSNGCYKVGKSGIFWGTTVSRCNVKGAVTRPYIRYNCRHLGDEAMATEDNIDLLVSKYPLRRQMTNGGGNANETERGKARGARKPRKRKVRRPSASRSD